MDDAHALDAVLAWLDAESLLRAAMVCRRWAARATQDGAWRGRVVAAAWTRGMTPRDAYVRSLRVRARWRSGRVAALGLAHGEQRVLAADGDWLACACGYPVTGRAVMPYCPVVQTRCVRIHDTTAARTVGVLPAHPGVAALSRRSARCATLPDSPHPCQIEVWGPPATTAPAADDAPTWRRVGAVPWGPRGASRCGRLWWWGADDVLFAHHTPEDPRLPVVAEWFDLAGGGAPRSVSRREYRTRGDVVWSGAAAWVVAASRVCALDPRAPPGDLPAPLVTLRHDFGGDSDREATALGDDRRLAMEWRHRGTDVSVVKLWDVRADSRPVAELRNPRCRGVACGTARGTVLLWALPPNAARLHGDAPPVGLAEWDPVRDCTEPLMPLCAECWPGSDGCRWADERRALCIAADGHAFLWDADVLPA